jgi:hypothetical protein
MGQNFKSIFLKTVTSGHRTSLFSVNEILNILRFNHGIETTAKFHWNFSIVQFADIWLSNMEIISGDFICLGKFLKQENLLLSEILDR